MARIAVLFSGQVRTLPATVFHIKEEIRKLRRSNHVDVFMHSWKSADPLSPDQLEAIARLEPYHTDFESTFPEIDGEIYLGTNPAADAPKVSASFAPMWASAASSFFMLQRAEETTQKKYDWVVRTRPDVFWSMEEEIQAAISTGVSRLPRRVAVLRSPHDVAAILERRIAEDFYSVGFNIDAALQRYRDRTYETFVPEFVLHNEFSLREVEWNAFDSPVALQRVDNKLFFIPQGHDYHALNSVRATLVPSWNNLRALPPMNESDRFHAAVTTELELNADEAQMVMRHYLSGSLPALFHTERGFVRDLGHLRRKKLRLMVGGALLPVGKRHVRKLLFSALHWPVSLATVLASVLFLTLVMRLREYRSKSSWHRPRRK